MIFFSEDIEFLREIFEVKKISPYHFHQKYLLSPAQMARTLRKFLNLEVIEFKDNEAILTKTGESWIIENRKKIFMNSNKYWKQVPEYMKQESLEINEVYKPNRKNLDSELFQIFEDGE